MCFKFTFFKGKALWLVISSILSIKKFLKPIKQQPIPRPEDEKVSGQRKNYKLIYQHQLQTNPSYNKLLHIAVQLLVTIFQWYVFCDITIIKSTKFIIIWQKKRICDKLNGTSLPSVKNEKLSEAEGQSGENYAMKIIYI